MNHTFSLLRCLTLSVVLILISGSASRATLAVASPAPSSESSSVTSNTTFIAVAAGGYHTCALTTNGGVKCWGSNDSGQLGDGTTLDRSSPVDVVGLSSGVKALAAGTRHTCALTDAGGVKCWGSDLFGRLGDDGSTDVQSTPVDVVGLNSGVRAIAAGEAQTCAVTDSGGVKCWGWNRRGVLGDGTTDTRRTPVDVLNLSSGAIAVATGMYHSCALLVNGTAKCWGAGGYGQLGHTPLDDEYSPVDVSGLTGATSIDVGTYHSCAVTNGGVQCWGNNDYGQLGDDTTDSRYLPVNVSGLISGVLTTTVGANYSCALTATGGLKCWGANYYGQLGDGTTLDRHVPVDVNNLTAGVGSFSVGSWHGCAVVADGRLRCWGLTDEYPWHLQLPLVLNNYETPQAAFTARPTSGIAPLWVTFDNTSSGSDLVNRWDFGDGVTSTLTNPTHLYAYPGSFTVTLTVSNSYASNTTATTINVEAAQEMIKNGGFEADLSDWQWTGYPDFANVITTVVHSGSRSVRLGIEPPAPIQYSYASVSQLTQIPAYATSARLSFWYWPRREDGSGPLTHSRQFVNVIDGNGDLLATLVNTSTDLPDWQYAEYDLSPYIGHTLKLEFGVYHDGDAVHSKRTSLLVDDVSLAITVAPLPVSDLMAYYPFNGNAADASGNHNEGVVYGAVLAPDRFGRPDRAYRFDGLDDYISVTYTSSLSFPHDLTVAAWIKTTDDAGGVAHEHNGGADGNFVFGLSQGGRFRFGRSATVISAQYDSQVVNDDQWHFVVGVYDDTHDVVKHYVDGVLVSSYPEINSLPDYHIPLIIGDENNHLYAFNGLIDDVRLYNRVLSEAEIWALWNADQ